MKKDVIKLIIMIFMLGLYGCATPSRMEWQKSEGSFKEKKANISGCKVLTLLSWPFDDLTKCMLRRGYKLVMEE